MDLDVLTCLGMALVGSAVPLTHTRGTEDGGFRRGHNGGPIDGGRTSISDDYETSAHPSIAFLANVFSNFCETEEDVVLMNLFHDQTSNWDYGRPDDVDGDGFDRYNRKLQEDPDFTRKKFSFILGKEVKIDTLWTPDAARGIANFGNIKVG